MTESVEPSVSPYVVKIFTRRGALVFQGTVSQQGDFVHLQEHAGAGRVATLRVHDMTPTLVEPVKNLAQRMQDEIRPGGLNLIDGMSGT